MCICYCLWQHLMLLCLQHINMHTEWSPSLATTFYGSCKLNMDIRILLVGLVSARRSNWENTSTLSSQTVLRVQHLISIKLWMGLTCMTFKNTYMFEDHNPNNIMATSLYSPLHWQLVQGGLSSTLLQQKHYSNNSCTNWFS